MNKRKDDFDCIDFVWQNFKKTKASKTNYRPTHSYDFCSELNYSDKK